MYTNSRGLLLVAVSRHEVSVLMECSPKVGRQLGKFGIIVLGTRRLDARNPTWSRIRFSHNAVL